jgi:Immunoglobulin I-set domain/Immunoglobulin domain
VKLGDLPRPFLISGLKEDQKIAEGDVLKLECGAIIYNYSSEIAWTRDGEVVVGSDELTVEENNTKFSWRKTLTWKNISRQDDGIYQCEVFVRDIPDVGEKEQVVISVHDTQAPLITTNFNHSTMKQALGDSLRLDCLVSGLPTPSLVWFKDDEVFTLSEAVTDETSMQRVMIDNSNSSITFTVLRLEDAGKYKCVAWNRVGQDFKELELEIPSEF